VCFVLNFAGSPIHPTSRCSRWGIIIAIHAYQHFGVWFASSSDHAKFLLSVEPHTFLSNKIVSLLLFHFVCLDNNIYFANGKPNSINDGRQLDLCDVYTLTLFHKS
jgi:hypothetical protein